MVYEMRESPSAYQYAHTCNYKGRACGGSKFHTQLEFLE